MEGAGKLPFYVTSSRLGVCFPADGINGMPVEGYKDAFSFSFLIRNWWLPISFSDRRVKLSFRVADTAVQIEVFVETNSSPERIQKIYETNPAKLGALHGNAFAQTKYAFLFFFYDGDIVTQAAMGTAILGMVCGRNNQDAKRLVSQPGGRPWNG